jgi:hypothetical protein
MPDVPAVSFDKKFLNNPQAQTFGCEPDFNAWKGTVNPKPHANDPTLRTAAAHVHISWENPTDEQRLELVKAADVFVVLPYLVNFEKALSAKRRELYGKAGCCRFKNYGIEHRVLDNTWIFNGYQTEFVWDTYMNAINFLNKGNRIDPDDADQIQMAINTHNQDVASLIAKRYNSL